MKKIIFAIILIWLWPVQKANCQTIVSDWILFLDLSPTPRLGNDRILRKTDENFHLEWRNRIGKMVSNNIAIGLMGIYRQYNLTEAVTYSLESNAAIYSYDYNTKNSLWGTGPFVTRFFQLSKKLQLQATLYGLYESGNGSYTMTLQGLECPSCFTPELSFGGRTGNIEHQEYRERSFYAGAEIGVSYSLTPKLSITSGINIVQYENYSISSGSRFSPTLSSSALYRQLQVQGTNTTFAFDRPIIHLGMMLTIGKKPI